MSWRAADHRRSEMFNANCSKCNERIQVPFDPKTPGKIVMCRNCRDIYMP